MNLYNLILIFFRKKISLYNKQSVDFLFNTSIVITIIIILSALSLNMTYPFLWFDEAVSFWIAKGVKIDALPFTKNGGFFDMIHYNKYFNLDPGGFSILLYYVSKINENHIIIRLLPFIIYLISILLFYNIVLNITKLKSASLLISCTYLMYPNFFQTSFELRAYSLELVSTLTCIYSIQSIDINSSFRKKIFYSVLIALLMTGRYSSILITFISITIIYFKHYQNKIKPNNNIIFFTILFLPFFVVSLSVYLIFYSYHREISQQLPYLNYLNNEFKYLFSPINLFVVIILITLPFFYLKRKNKILLFTIFTNLFFIVLSFLGKYPYDPSSSRCNFIALSIFISLIIVLNNLIKRLLEIKAIKLSLSFIIVMFVSSSLGIFLPRFDKPVEIYSTLNSIDFSQNPKIYVDRWANPSLRYLYEFGNLKGKRKLHNYPMNFELMSEKNYVNTLEKIINAYSNNKKIKNINMFDIVIGPEIVHYTKIDNKMKKLNESFYIKIK
jgi:hypothetical protein